MIVVAHRGASAHAPENTLVAVAAAVEAGADVVEVDVRLDADGVPVVLHDATLDRTTDGAGPVAATSSTALRRLDAGSWWGPGFAGERVPTLADVADLLAGTGTGLLVELKGVWSAPDVGRAAAVLRTGDLAQRTTLQSFARESVLAARRAAPDLPRALLVVRPGGPVDLVALARDPVTEWASSHADAALEGALAREELGVVGCHPAAAAVVATPGVVDGYRRAGLRVVVWTANEPEVWRELLRAGVDGIVTDDPRWLRAHLDARSAVLEQDAPAPDRADLLRLATRR